MQIPGRDFSYFLEKRMHQFDWFHTEGLNKDNWFQLKILVDHNYTVHLNCKITGIRH